MKYLTNIVFIMFTVSSYSQWLPVQGVHAFQSSNPGSASTVPIAINADGTVRAYADYANDVVRLSIFKEGTWKAMGTDIEGFTIEENFGHSISLSASGMTLAIAAQGLSGWSSTIPHDSKCFVFDFDGNDWVQRGEVIISDQIQGSNSGLRCDLSADGNLILLAEPFHDNFISNGNLFGPNYGKVSVLEWNGNAWVTKGESINGSDDESFRLGENYSLSPDGNTFAISLIENDIEYIRVYRWNGVSWIRLGTQIENDKFVQVLSWENGQIDLNGNGDIMVLGEPNQYDEHSSLGGEVYIFEWNGFEWAPRGSTLANFNVKSAYGTSVSINYSGSRICVGIPFSKNLLEEDEDFKGSIEVYEWNGSEYDILGDPIYTQFNNRRLGMSVQISGDGSRFIASTDYGESNYSRVFEYVAPLSSDRIVDNRLKVYPNPTANSITLSIESFDSGVILSQHGQPLLEFQRPTIDVSKLPSGLYFVKVNKNNNLIAFTKFLKQ